MYQKSLLFAVTHPVYFLPKSWMGFSFTDGGRKSHLKREPRERKREALRPRLDGGPRYVNEEDSGSDQAALFSLRRRTTITIPTTASAYSITLPKMAGIRHSGVGAVISVA